METSHSSQNETFFNDMQKFLIQYGVIGATVGYLLGITSRDFIRNVIDIVVMPFVIKLTEFFKIKNPKIL